MLNNEYANFFFNENAGLVPTFLVGITFIASGLVKLDDPIGFSYKIEEYLNVLAIQWSRYLRLFIPYKLPIAVGIATLEAVLGTALLVNWQLYWTLRGLLLLTLFFTGLTLYTATSKRMKSCGCFGNAFNLTPWQSFFKSSVLLVLLSVLLALSPATKEITLSNSYYWVFIALMASLALSFYTVRHLSIFSLEPYHIGSRLGELAKSRRPLRYLYVLEQAGKIIKTEQYPQTADHKLLKMELMNPEDLAVEAHFRVWQEQKEVTPSLLLGLKLLIVFQKTSPLPSYALPQLRALLQQLSIDVQPILVLPEGQGHKLAAELALPAHTATPDLLRTMVNAQVGLLLLQDGEVKGKWSYRNAKQVLRYFALRNYEWKLTQKALNSSRVELER